MSKWKGAPKLIFILGPQISLNGPDYNSCRTDRNLNNEYILIVVLYGHILTLLPCICFLFYAIWNPNYFHAKQYTSSICALCMAGF